MGDGESGVFEEFGEEGTIGEGKEISGDFGGALPEQSASVGG